MGVDILGVDVLGVDVLKLDITWHCTISTYSYDLYEQSFVIRLKDAMED